MSSNSDRLHRQIYIITYSYSTCTTYRSVYHDGFKLTTVEYLILSQLAYKFHHNHGADSNYQIIFYLLSTKSLRRLVTIPITIGAVICGYIKFSCHSFHLILKYKVSFVLVPIITSTLISLLNIHLT